MPLKFTYDKELKTITTIPGWAADFNNQDAKNISADQAYKASAWAFRAVNIRADAIANGPLKLYDGNDEEIDKHPVLALLHTVNSEWNAGDLWRYTEASYCVHGSAFWQKIRAGKRVIELKYLNPKSIEIKYSPDGISGFTQTLGGKEVRTTKFERNDLVYFRGSYDPNSDLTGIAPLAMGAQAALGEKAADQFMAAFYKNYAIPPLILVTDQPVTESQIEVQQKWWQKMFGGGNKFKVGLLGSGLKPMPLTSNIKDLMLSTTKTELHRTICVALGVDELLLSATGAADRTPVDAALYHLYTVTIVPRWTYYEEVLDAELLPEYPDLIKRGAYFKFDQAEVKPLQRDQNEWAKTLGLLVEKGIIKPETAAIELGYTLEDVPGQDEQPPAGTDEQPAAAKPEQAAEPGLVLQDDQEQPAVEIRGGLLDALEKWHRKAYNALKAGKPAAVDFVSIEIPDDLHQQITDELENCKTVADVTDLFRDLRLDPADDNGNKALARAINRAADVLQAAQERDGDNG